MEREKGYHKLVVWRKVREFIKLLYAITDRFPSNESFGLTSQVRRATLSVLLNIVEGDRRKSRKEFLRFLDTADASLVEVEACLEIALDLNYLTKADFENLEEKRKEIAIMLFSLIKAVRKQT